MYNRLLLVVYSVMIHVIIGHQTETTHFCKNDVKTQQQKSKLYPDPRQ